MAKKKMVGEKAASKDDMMSMMSSMSCCMNWNGLIHVVAGVGIGYLIVAYFGLGNLMVWGWVLVGLGVLGHLVGKTKCDSCSC